MKSSLGMPQKNMSPSEQSSFSGRWLDFFITDMDGIALRVFEVLFTLSFLMWMTHCFLEWKELLTDWGFHLNAAEAAGMRYPEPFPLLSGAYIFILGLLMLTAAVCLILNRWRRLALLLLFLSSLYMQGVDFIAASTVNKFFIAIYGILLISPGYVRNARDGRLMICAVPVRVIQATLILEYLASGIAKAFYGDWLKYNDILYTLVQGSFRTDFAAWCLRTLPVWSWTVMQWITLLFELEALVLFCVKKLRPIAFVIGIGFHLMIALIMKDLIFFSAQMWTFYALFVTAERWRAIGNALATWTGFRFGLKALCQPS
jgi:hypothetical protein